MRPSTNVEDIRSLDPGDEKMSAFADGVIEDSTEPVEEDGTLATVNVVEGGVNDGRGSPEAEGNSSDVGEE